jgi:uncharacterized protein YggE
MDRNLRRPPVNHAPAGMGPAVDPPGEDRMTKQTLRAVMALPFALAAAMPAAAQQVPMHGGTIRVTASGEATAQPDRAYVDLGLETTAPTAKAAADQNAVVMERVITALVRAGVARTDIETRDYNVYPDYQPSPDGRGEPRVRGYRVSNVVSARTDRVATVGAILDAALAAGANRVQGVRFTLRDPQAQRAIALRQAMERGRAEAQLIAEAMGVRLGILLDASTSTDPRPRPMMEMAMRQSADMAAATPIQPGEQSVGATVNLTYAIVQ